MQKLLEAKENWIHPSGRYINEGWTGLNRMPVDIKDSALSTAIIGVGL